MLSIFCSKYAAMQLSQCTKLHKFDNVTNFLKKRLLEQDAATTAAAAYNAAIIPDMEQRYQLRRTASAGPYQEVLITVAASCNRN